MLFNSFQFLIFFSLVTIIFYVLPHKIRWVFLLCASYIFYAAWKPILLLLLLFTTFINYLFAIAIHVSNKKKLFLVIDLIISFGVLFVFKYLNFVNMSLTNLLGTFDINYPSSNFNIILPMGISFYTFQQTAYVIDVYRERYKPERNFFKFSLFITFFPQLVAGPIERTDNLFPQLFALKKLRYENVVTGAKFIIFGYFKKIVIADRICIIVDNVFNNPHAFNNFSMILATILFSFQIYCDFSGYSDIAVGCAKILDIDLMQNFKQPYLASNIKEFWNRWHISLSSWLKDYIYIPLGGNRVPKHRYFINILITFLTSGIWHGANWTFFIWGIIHGIYQILNRVKACTKLDYFKFPRFISTIITFTIVTYAWVFFRANSISDAIYISKNIFLGFDNWTSAEYFLQSLSNIGVGFFELLICTLSLIILILSDYISKDTTIHDVLKKKNFIISYGFYSLITIFVLTAGVYYDAGTFIYFQF